MRRAVISVTVRNKVTLCVAQIMRVRTCKLACAPLTTSKSPCGKAFFALSQVLCFPSPNNSMRPRASISCQTPSRFMQLGASPCMPAIRAALFSGDIVAAHLPRGSVVPATSDTAMKHSPPAGCTRHFMPRTYAATQQRPRGESVYSTRASVITPLVIQEIRVCILQHCAAPAP